MMSCPFETSDSAAPVEKLDIWEVLGDARPHLLIVCIGPPLFIPALVSVVLRSHLRLMRRVVLSTLHEHAAHIPCDKNNIQ